MPTQHLRAQTHTIHKRKTQIFGTVGVFRLSLGNQSWCSSKASVCRFINRRPRPWPHWCQFIWKCIPPKTKLMYSQAWLTYRPRIRGEPKQMRMRPCAIGHRTSMEIVIHILSPSNILTQFDHSTNTIIKTSIQDIFIQKWSHSFSKQWSVVFPCWEMAAY